MNDDFKKLIPVFRRIGVTPRVLPGYDFKEIAPGIYQRVPRKTRLLKELEELARVRDTIRRVLTDGI